ncbi:hypothetical protein EVAR_23940_1 [Eumeta japonica]|uniref:Uncharacterized protein n=1 Tax=Eumeta variegata TaxID=151549 RepID=A0A4C1V1Y5_EUMVA|nr:hypothetical protein EVAR_23940_1 [Eumeta japonica]
MRRAREIFRGNANRYERREPSLMPVTVRRARRGPSRNDVPARPVGFDVFVESGRQHSDADGATALWVLSDQHLGIDFAKIFQFELKIWDAGSADTLRFDDPIRS